ncbi:MAG: thrombospondin type 3 repeat-containing protein [Archangium sp.]|nr:thrombospondin type 3 repeat-containing protein [Archangium sp.]
MPLPCVRLRSWNHALLASLVLVASATRAQDRGFTLNRLDGTAAGSTQFLVERPWYSSVRLLAVGVTGDSAHNPLQPRLQTGRGPLTPIVSNAIAAHLDLAVSFLDRVQLSASLPLTFLETGRPEVVSQVAPLQTIGLGDPRVGLLVRIAGQPDLDGISLHLGALVWIPIGGAATHQGDTGLRVMPRAVLAGAFGVGRWALDGAFLHRPYASFGPPALGMTAASEARLGLALGASLLNDRLTLGPEARFSVQVAGENAFALNGMSLELLGGLQYLIADRILLGVAGGAGFFGAAGTPDARGLVRLAWAPRSNNEPERPREVVLVAEPSAEDPDRDGVPTAIDRCPFEPESRNGVRDEDGCPEFEMPAGSALAAVLAPRAPVPPAEARAADQPVALATAPEQPADAGVSATPLATTIDAGVSATPLATTIDAGGSDKPLATNIDAGAVDVAVAFFTTDSDGDGVADEADRCPIAPEDRDGFEDEDGCPELDNDDDGIADFTDRCPNSAETANGVSDEDGCPDVAPDADADGIADVADRCPWEPETHDGVRDDDGCPEHVTAATPSLAMLLDSAVEPGAPPALLAITEAPSMNDSDQDGISDEEDRCPSIAEDADAFEDGDGCRELDNDEDGIADAKDLCPEAAETFNGWKDDDGCPDESQDLDGDGVEYEVDRCPFEPGNASDGCPHAAPPALVLPDGVMRISSAPEPTAAELAAADFDGDGVSDEADPCPTSAEDLDGFEDEDGCPELDNDQDGVPDRADKCPLAAETVNGKNDSDGCPDVGAGAVTIQEHALVISKVVRFKTASANLEASALPLLAQVAAKLRAARTLSIEISGHTDDVGNAPRNIVLSKKRAETIRAVLIKAGVAASRLSTTGYGPTRPVASNKTAKGREQNRRVEFLILGETP